MHFGKFLKSQQFEPWSDKYLDYKHLKTVLERDERAEKARSAREDVHLSITESSRLLAHVAVSLEFASLLDEEVEKVIIFFLQQQGSIAQQLFQLRQEHKRLLADASSSCQPQCWNTLYERYHATAVELLHLIQYVELNLTGIRKILKKHDKITGRGLSSRYLTRGNTDGERPFLSPLFEQGGVDSLALKLEDSFDELYMYQQQARPRNHFFRSDTTPDSDVESKQHPDPDNTRFNTYHGDLSSLVNNVSPLHGEHILREIRNARQKMKETRDFVHILAAQMLLISPEGEEEEDDAMPGMEPPDVERDRKRRISNRLNFISTFLHLTDYYIVAPGCGTYAEKLGGTASLAGMIIGMNSVAALVSTVLYSWWTSRSYKAPLLCATSCQILGDIIYAVALPWGSLRLVMLGRLVSGFGSARALNRRYIADTFPSRERTAASATFVTAGALGTSAGPAFAALLYFAVPEDSDQPYWQVENAPCWVMAVVWAIYLMFLIYYFEEPARKTHHAPAKTGEEQHLLLENEDGKEIGTMNTPKVQPLWKNVPVMATFGIYFCLKFILESLLSSTATLTNFYFHWDGSLAGWYLAGLGFLVLPANWAVALVCRRYDDRELILAIEFFMLAGCLAILKYAGYAVPQYVFGSVLIFVSTNALEGPTMSLLSKTIPAVYSRGLFNVGLLATEAGTLGRAVGDVILTMSGANGLEYVLNNAFGAMSALSLATIGMTWQLYDYLEPIEKDD